MQTWQRTVQDFLADQSGGDPSSWDLVESTFALHTLPGAERSAVLRAVCPRTGRLAVVEFDVPEVAVGSPAHLRPGAVRATFEQPADAWVEQVRGAGFTDVVVTVLDDYWSSPTFLLTARGSTD